MKRIIWILAIVGAVAASSARVFGQEVDKKAEEARKDLKTAKQDLREAKIDSAADYNKFRSAAELKIKDNREKIAMLKEKKSERTKEVAAKYDKDVLALETRNAELEKKIKESSNTTTTRWAAFKREFNHDMDELGRAIKDIGVNNSK